MRQAKTGYGSRALARATLVAQACRAIPGTGLRATLRRMFAGLPLLFFYYARLPRLMVPLSREPAGEMIRQHLGYRFMGRVRFTRAQGVLLLPADYGAYIKGRKRQAVRTNIAHARAEGITVERHTIERWTVPPGDPRATHVTAAVPAESWFARDREGKVLADATLVIDRRVALLERAESTSSSARWLLHAAIVERLCGECEMLLTNSEDVPRLSPGVQHYQRLLGYSIVRLRRKRTLGEWIAEPAARLAALCTLAVALIVVVHLIALPMPSVGERALVWLAALVAVRRASNRAGVTTLTGALAAAVVVAADPPNDERAAVAYLLAGAVVDGAFALFPRLSRGTGFPAPVGIAAMLVTAVAPGFPTVSHQPLQGAQPMASLAFAIVFGACAAELGWRLGGPLWLRILASRGQPWSRSVLASRRDGARLAGAVHPRRSARRGGRWSRHGDG